MAVAKLSPLCGMPSAGSAHLAGADGGLLSGLRCV